MKASFFVVEVVSQASEPVGGEVLALFNLRDGLDLEEHAIELEGGDTAYILGNLWLAVERHSKADSGARWLERKYRETRPGSKWLIFDTWPPTSLGGRAA